MPGSIFKHKGSGLYVTKIDGQWRYFRTRAEAQDYWREQSAHPAEVAGVGPKGSRTLTVADFFTGWFTRQEIRVKSKTLRLKTLNFYRTLYRNYVHKQLGPERMWRMTANKLNALYLDLLNRAHSGKALKGTTVQHLAKFLRLAFKDAKKKTKVILENRADDAEIPANDTKEKRAYDFEQSRLFLGSAKRAKHYLPYRAMLENGFREEDTCGLRWQDVDFSLQAALIRQVIYPNWGNKKEGRKGEWYIGPPKTKAGVRAVKLSPAMVKELRALQEEQEQAKQGRTICEQGKDCRKPHCPHWHDLDLVFCQPNGKWLHMANITRSKDYNEVSKRAGIPRLTMYELRHTHITLLNRVGAPEGVIHSRVGHTSSRATQIYNHVALEDQTPYVLRLQEALFPSTPLLHHNSRHNGEQTEAGNVENHQDYQGNLMGGRGGLEPSTR